MIRFFNAFWLFLFCSALAQDVLAEQADSAGDERQEVVLWTFEAAQVSGTELGEFQDSLSAALPAEDARHLLGEEGLSQYISAKTTPLPPCLAGLEECASPQALAFDALGLTLAIHVEITRRDADEWSARARWIDRRGQIAGTSTVQASTTRDLAFALAGDIFDATSTVFVDSDPPGARVEIDDDPVGTTPLKYRLALGEHRYRLTLDAYRPVEGVFSLTEKGQIDLGHSLEALPGTISFMDAPADAEVYLDGKLLGLAAEPITLEGGSYELEMRADGFDAYRETVDLQAGQTIKRRVNMEKTHPLLRDVPSEAIIANRYIGRIGYEHGFQNTTFLDSRGRVGDEHFSFLSFSDAPLDPAKIDPDLRRWTNSNGLRLDLSYHWENFGLVLLSASYISTSLSMDALLDSSASSAPLEAELLHLSRLQLRPFQLQYRFFYKNLSPFAELGTGINIQWLKADGADLDNPVTLSNSDAFWTLGLGTNYFFTPSIFGTLRYGAQFYLTDGPGVEHMLSLGAGLALPNFFGVEAEPPETL